MGALTQDLPKGMLSLGNKTLIELQIEVLKQVGLDDIVIVTGYQAEKIMYGEVRYCQNPNYATTNMVESLLCARKEMIDDLLVAYSDIIYTPELATAVISSGHDIGVAVDQAWRDYWMLRYGSTETDLESLSVSPEGMITEIGRPLESSEGLQYRYIGLLRFSRAGVAELLDLYDRRRQEGTCWKQSGNSFANGYMTDLLDGAIASGLTVRPVIASGGWLEFDTVQDYERSMAMLQSGWLGSFSMSVFK